MTLDFSGPPLSLPGEEPPGTEASSGEPDGLALDLAELDERPDAKNEHDGWTRDRLRRGSGVHPSVPPSIRPPPPTPDPRALPADQGDALALVNRSRPSIPDMDLASEMADRYALGDFTGALRAAELLLGRDPDDAEARRYADSSRDRLVQLYSSRIGSLARVPRVTVPEQEVRWLGIDHKAGFLLSRIDGTHTVEEVIDISGMPRLEALKMLAELLEAGAIAFD